MKKQEFIVATFRFFFRLLEYALARKMQLEWSVTNVKKGCMTWAKAALVSSAVSNLIYHLALGSVPIYLYLQIYMVFWLNGRVCDFAECQCNMTYSNSTICDTYTGQCPCRQSPNGGFYGGRQCTECRWDAVGKCTHYYYKSLFRTYIYIYIIFKK